MTNLERVAAYIDGLENAETIRCLLAQTFQPGIDKPSESNQHISLVVSEVLARLDDSPANE